VALIERMFDKAIRRQIGSERSDRSHQNMPAMSVARLEFFRREKERRLFDAVAALVEWR
jgi:hypothetical protein